MERKYFIFFPLSPDLTPMVQPTPTHQNPSKKRIEPPSSSFEFGFQKFVTKKARTSESSSTSHSSIVSSSDQPAEVTSVPVELKLFDDSPRTSSLGATNASSTHHVQEESSRIDEVSTELKLYEDPWKMTKNLTASDLNDLCRLLLPKNLVKEHIYPYMSPSVIEEFKTDDGVWFNVWDVDTRTSHVLKFRFWTSSKSHVFAGYWKQDFVNRRNLQKGDKIGLFWDVYYQRFSFSVLSRSPIDPVADQVSNSSELRKNMELTKVI